MGSGELEHRMVWGRKERGAEGYRPAWRRAYIHGKGEAERLKNYEVGHWGGKDAATFFLWTFPWEAGATFQASWDPKEQKVEDFRGVVKNLDDV